MSAEKQPGNPAVCFLRLPITKMLKPFLPRDHETIVKDFRATLERELRHYLGQAG
jgi:hypothetical protein